MITANIFTSLIIPTYNKASRLKLTLESICKQQYDGNFEVIIVNDGSTDNTLDIVKCFSDKIRYEKNIEVIIVNTFNLGRSAARNIGVENSKGDLVIFSDDDMLLDNTYIKKHVEIHSEQEYCIVHGKIFTITHTKFFKNPSTGELYEGGMAKEQLKSKVITSEMIISGEINDYLCNNTRISKFEQDIETLYNNTSSDDSYVRWIGFTGGNVSLKKEHIVKAGLFDSNMGKEWGCEDLELGYRLYKSGFKFIYSAVAKNYHISHYREDSKEIHNKSMNYFINKHRDKSIILMKEYFNNNIPSLIEWKRNIDYINDDKDFKYTKV